VTRIGELETTLAVNRATGLNIPEDTILRSHRRENPKTYRSGVKFICYATCSSRNLSNV
jgi:hypothetical protein